MLVLSQNPKQRIILTLPDGRKVTIENLSRRTKLGFTAPADVKILREELEGRAA